MMGEMSMISVPPSILGFVCKPDMPPHINILFRARPPIPYMKIEDKPKLPPYSGSFNGHPNLLSYFEKENTCMNKELLPRQEQRLKNIAEKMENSKLLNREQLNECMYHTKNMEISFLFKG